MIINCGALPCLLNLLQTSHKKSIKKEACWTISNITAGTKDQIQAVIDSHILPPLVQARRMRLTYTRVHRGCVGVSLQLSSGHQQKPDGAAACAGAPHAAHCVFLSA